MCAPCDREGEKIMFNVDKVSSVPIYEQVIAEFERYVMAGLMGADDKLPSVRALSLELSVNPNTIQKAYTELERQKLCYSVPGSGRFVAKNAIEKIRQQKRGLLSDVARLAQELKASGIDEQELIDTVHSVYIK